MSSVLPESLAEGRFQLLEVIGEGGMATVYRAFDQRLQRPRAIKVLSPALSGRPQLRRRFMAEAQTMATLEESRVVRIFDVAEEGDRCYIVMELVDGGSLLDRIRDFGPLPPRLAAQVGLQLCESLQAAHDAGVIHRDIKPHNILLTRNGEIRITDFGIAQVQQEGDNNGLTKTGAVMGTWGFMAPEQKSDAKNVDARADLYSVGATLWSVLRGDTPPELFMADQEGHMLDGIPDALAEVIRRATRYRREERYPSVRAMADSIRSLQGLLPEDPPDTPPLVSATPGSREGRLDTIDQFRTPPPQPAMGTMVPDVAELPPPVSLPHPPTAAPPTLPLIEPRLPAGRTGVDLSFTTEDGDAQRPDRRWMLYAGIGLMGLGLAAVIVVGKLWNPSGDNGEQLPIAVAEMATPPADAAAPPTGEVAVPPPAAPVAALPSAGTPATSPAARPADAATTAAPPATPGLALTDGSTAAPATTPSATPATPAAPATEPSAAPPAAVVADAAVPAPDPGAEVKAAPKAPARLAVSAPGAVSVGENAAFSASLAPGYVVKLYFRAVGSGAFREKTMSAAGGTYTTSIKVDESMSGGLDYFVAATDDRGNTVREGSALKPLRVTVNAPAAP